MIAGDAMHNQYTPPIGLQRLRSAIKDYYSSRYNASYCDKEEVKTGNLHLKYFIQKHGILMFKQPLCRRSCRRSFRGSRPRGGEILLACVCDMRMRASRFASRPGGQRPFSPPCRPEPLHARTARARRTKRARAWASSSQRRVAESLPRPAAGLPWRQACLGGRGSEC